MQQTQSPKEATATAEVRECSGNFPVGRPDTHCQDCGRSKAAHQSPKAGERTQPFICPVCKTEQGNFHRCSLPQESTVDPVYGFLTSLRDCTFHFSEGQRELTIKAPDGGKIGLPFVEEMKAMTADHIERNHRIAAPQLKRMLLNALTQLEQHDRGTADAIRREYRLEIINR